MLKKLSILLFILTFSALSGFAQKGATAANADDETALRQIVKQIEDGWNTKDGKAFAAPFATDADYVVVNGMYIKGRDAIERGHSMIFSTVYKDSRNAATIKGIRFPRPDVAIVHIEWNLTFRPSPDAKEENQRAINTLFVMKENGKWSITAFHNTPIRTENQTSK